MKAKMNFLATKLDPHEFIVGFEGGIPPPKGPMILLENCDLGPLLAWLKKHDKMTPDVENQMKTFMMHIAVGMRHLHNHHPDPVSILTTDSRIIILILYMYRCKHVYC